MKKALLICTLFTGFLLTHTTFASGISFNCGGGNCFTAGVDALGGVLGRDVGVVTGKGIAEAVQDLIVYILSFLSLIALIYIMYAGAQLLLNPSDEESAAKTKKIIIGVVSGIVIIWFAWWIVSTIFFILGTGTATASVPVAVAENQVRSVDFDTYSNNIKALKTKIQGEYNADVMRELSLLVDGAYQHLPDRDDLYENKQKYDAVKKAISTYNLQQELIDQGLVETTLDNFLSQSKVFRIDAKLVANPSQGDAPLSVTLKAEEAIDGSGTVIPNTNFIWWMRTAEGVKTIGTGKIVNYTFGMEGTYSVYLTINSASRNNQGFVDTVSFQKNVAIEVGQPKIQFVVKINDQIADQIVKIPTKEAVANISIDASETVFASGYTIKKTEWDFGNGSTDTNVGGPQFELQKYDPGEYVIKLTLTRNDDESFHKNITLKIGDPLAAISLNDKTPSKGEKVVFQARKISKETDVQYLWEVKGVKQDTVLYSFPGTRMEYTFMDTGRYFVSLTAIKGDARDKETMEVMIDSRPPNVEFTTDMVSAETPNIYLFDGTNSFDPDYPDNQRLRFEWFVNDAPIQLIETNEQNSRGKYIFPGKATYRVTLRVTDADGKNQEVKKEIKITSTLSLKLNMRPEVVKRGAAILFVVTAPPQANIYEWKIGSEDAVVTKSNRLTTSFPMSGAFPITVKVTSEEGDTNTVSGKIYVTDNDKPFSILDIKNNSSFTAAQTSICNNKEAIVIDRTIPISFSAEKSVNTDGKSDNLTYFWKIGLNKTSTNKNLSYTFDELGCEEIILTVADKRTGTSHTTTAWVKVINVAPRFSDIQVMPENLDMDPMRINLKMTGAKDPDGAIRGYTWYYYTDQDDQPQGFRITRVPETTFVLPKIAGRYYFDVMMEDSDGLKVNTKEVSEKRFSTQDLYVNTNLATPIIDDFTADATEVNFGEKTRLSVSVRTALDNDVSDKAEYRWDIDGDGFYDIKTSTPFYEFQYKYPGEYNPKVKVTHKGMSATKSLTIVVKNRLIARATLQTVGTKIVAYNISSGVFKNVNWYLDDKKISENRDYLVFDTGSSSLKNLKLEVSDGSITESVVYTIEKNLKNQILLKKIVGPLIIISSASGADMTEVPEDVIWLDPMVPLFIYLGESRGDTIRYYAIDTDIDIDTDLNGKKNDDADNIGTASYRNGRPFQVPKGNKRVTIMRIRLIGQNNEDIASKQIRVTRSFLALPEENMTITKGPKNFNLTQEDKDRIDKLRNLVKGAPDVEKVEYNKLLDQLGDIWYDTADRTQTLILFSLAVDSSPTLSADLKKKILEQINLIYTQGDDQMNERQAARKVIEDALSNSTYKTKIFGDGTNIGLIDEMLDNPEYYDANLAIKGTIYNDYVDPDKTLSAEVKKVIEEKLMVLVGSPIGVIDNPPPPPPPTTTSKLPIILWILGGIVCVIFGVVGIAYVRQRGVTPHDAVEGEPGHGEDTGGHQLPQSTSDFSPVNSDTSTTPDWLKEGGSPFGDEDVFSEKVASSSAETHQPDWIQDTATLDVPTNITVIPSSEPQKNSVVPDISQEGIMPATSQNDSNDSIDSPQVDVSIPTEPGDTPDWLNPTLGQESVVQDTADIVPSQAESPQNTMDSSSVLVEEIGASESVPVLPVTEKNETILGENENSGTKNIVPEAVYDEDMPDWLRGAETEVSGITNEETALPIDTESSPQASSDKESVETALPPGDVLNISVNEAGSPTKETKQNTGKKPKKASSTPALEEESPDMPVEKKPKKKSLVSPQKSIAPEENLLEPAHDMLLPPSDNPTA